MVTDDKLAELARKFGRVKHVVYNGTDLVFRKPRRHEAQDFATKIESDDPVVKSTSSEQLAQILIEVCGEQEGAAAKQAFLALLEEYPLLCRFREVASALSKLTGATQDDTAQKKDASTPLSANTPTTSQAG